MEKLMNKTRVLLWVAIALTVFNFATIVTVLWQFNKDKKDAHREHKEMLAPPSPLAGKMIKKKLQLSDKQSIKFDSIEDKFKSKSKDIFEEMKGLRGEMIKEITSENPDSAKLMKLTKDLGDLHINLKMNTFDFYFSMKKVCLPEQQKELSNIFRGMFLFDGMPGQGRFPLNKFGPNRHRPQPVEGFEDFSHDKRIPSREMVDCPKDRYKQDGQKPKHDKPGEKDTLKNK